MQGFDAVGDRWGAAFFLSRAGLAYEDAGELKSALEAFSAAGQAFAEVGDIRGHALQIGSARS